MYNRKGLRYLKTQVHAQVEATYCQSDEFFSLFADFDTDDDWATNSCFNLWLRGIAPHTSWVCLNKSYMGSLYQTLPCESLISLAGLSPERESPVHYPYKTSKSYMGSAPEFD